MYACIQYRYSESGGKLKHFFARVLPLVMVVFVLLLSGCSSLKRKKRHEPKLTTQQSELLTKYEKLLGSDLAANQIALYEFINAWWGVPHKIGGNDKSGVDCSGFVVQLFNEVYQKSVPRTTEDLFLVAKPVDTAQLETGDLVFIIFQGRKKISHVGVYLQEGKFVHASTSKGVRIDYMRDSYYRRQQFSGGRIE